MEKLPEDKIQMLPSQLKSPLLFTVSGSGRRRGGCEEGQAGGRGVVR